MNSFEATLTSKGQITVPSEVRARLKLKEGDRLEFYFDSKERLMVRPRNASASAVFENAPKRKASRPMRDDEAIAAAVTAKDRRSRRRRAA